MRYFVYAALGIGALAVLIAHFRTGRPLRSLLAALVQGSVSLLAVSALGTFTGVGVAVNPYTLGAAGVFGLPGTIALVLLDALFQR